MYFLNLKSLITDLYHEKIRLSYGIFYFALFCIAYILGFSFINALPTLYTFIFTLIKNYLEQQAKPANLQIYVYTDMQQLIHYINLIILMSGIFICFIFYANSIRTFFKRISTLLWTLNVRIVLVTTIIFLFFILIFGSYFGYKLTLLTYDIPKGPVIFKPFKLLFKVTGTYPVAKSVWDKTYILPKAKILFNQINNISFIMYCIAQMISIFSTIWIILRLYIIIHFLKKSKQEIGN
ncbi:MAG: hypothetical protein WDZ41_01985 [Candidatus Babeliales bacterium]